MADDLTAELDAAEDIITGRAKIEYAHEMSGGGFHVWNTEPYIEKIYPLAEQIKNGQKHGGKVYRRTIIVVEDWEEVPGA